MYAEITKEAFLCMVDNTVEATRVDVTEHARKVYYFARGCELVAVNNFLSATTQFYVKDINA